MLRIISITLMVLGSLAAQTFSGRINPYRNEIQSVRQPKDTVKILAVLADFQEDKDGATFGNGKFSSIFTSDYGNSIIDPLPHDSAYFEAHLRFLRNYFYKSSGGKQNIVFTILPGKVTVSRTMRNYSPAPKSEDMSPVAEFSREVWKKADSLNAGFIFNEYDFFIIFHAGVGRDVSLPGSLGNERDLPSIYLNSSVLNIPVQSGSFFITNSAIIPETESRELSSLGGTALLELSINGLLAANTASFLQLPDLYDTETGLSAIGRFGLMDGQAIFAYNGLFPPEPSAWEKIYLGWKTPVEASLTKNEYSLVPSIIANLSDTTILKVNLSSSEYYLIENRQRDAKTNGAVISYLDQGENKTITFPKDTTGFQSYSVDSLQGVITDVDEYDWALPGSGIVIWHIDEKIINDKLAENKINTDMKMRGVDVEEADGIQDIGVQFQTVFGDIVIGEGEQRDFWYSGNTADLYQNRFSSDTRPGTLTNLGAKSLVTVSGFSDLSNRMSFKVTFGDSVIKPVSVNNLPGLSDQKYFLSVSGLQDLWSVIGSGKLHLFNYSGNEVYSSDFSSAQKPLSFMRGDTSYIIGSGSSLNIFTRVSGGTESVHSYGVGSELLSSPVLMLSSNDILVGGSSGKIYRFKLSASPFNVTADSLILNGVDEINAVAADGDYFAAVGKSGTKHYFTDKTGILVELESAPENILLSKNSAGQYVSAVTSEDKIVFIVNCKLVSSIQKDVPGKTGAALADLREDGNVYVVFNDGSRIKAYNSNGAPADNFPFTDPEGKAFDSFILAADFEGDQASELIGFTTDGRIFSIDGRTGKITSGFPITAGSRLKGSPIIYNNAGKLRLSLMDSLKNLYTWEVSSVAGKLFWSEELGNSSNSGFVPAAEKTNFVNTFFPADKLYNWPNPVYEGKTFIRYYVAETSRINIKIFDLAGSLVQELSSDAVGGSDNETAWDITGIQSGVYLAWVEASSGSKTESNIIKIAVIR